MPDFSSLRQAALALHENQRFPEAEQAYHSALQLNDQDDPLWHGLSRVYEAMGRPTDAAKAMAKAVSLQPHHAPYHNRMGRLLEAIQDPDQALRAYRNAIALDASFFEPYLPLAELLMAQGETDEAEAVLRQASALQPQNPTVYHRLGQVLGQQGRLDEAIAALENAHTLRSNDAEILEDLGQAYQQRAAVNQMRADLCLGFAAYRRSDHPASITHFQRFLETPGAGIAADVLEQAYRALINSLQALGQQEKTIAVYQAAVQRLPQAARLHYNRVLFLRDSGLNEAAATAGKEAVQALPDSLAAQLADKLLLPILYRQPEEIPRTRQRFLQGLEALGQISLDTAQERQSALEAIERHANFYLGYQGYNDRGLQVAYGKLVHRVLSANFPDWMQPRPVPPATGKLRIGYLSDCMRRQTVGKLSIGWLRHCDRQRFEVYCYSINSAQDEITAEFQRHSDSFRQLPNNLAAIAQQVLADQLHVLVFLDIGMHPKVNAIAGLRLAPVQAVTWGHPITSGLPNMDYFLSCELMEPENAEEHYCEQLVLLPNIGFSYEKPSIPTPHKTRADFGLRDDAVVYLSCQSLFKYLPQYDWIFAAIAQQVPQAQFAFLEHSAAAVNQLFQARLQRAFGAVGLRSEDFCVMVPRLGHVSYLSLNQRSDIFLDTFDWSGGNTTLEAIACGLPVVTRPGAFMRGRHAYGILRMLGVTDTIAASEAEYVQVAVRLGQEPTLRQQVRERIIAAHDRLYGDRACVQALETFFEQAVGRTRPGGVS